MKKNLLTILIPFLLLGQDPEPIKLTSRLFYDASNNLEYECVAGALQNTASFLRSDSSLTNIVDAANTATATTANAHGLAVGNLVAVAGGTIDADLNGTYYVQTTPTTTTFTFTTASVTDATYTEATLGITTRAARSTAAIWTIKKFITTATGITHVQSSNPNSICDNRAVTTGATKVTYR